MPSPSKKIAVAVVHGIGKQKLESFEPIKKNILASFKKEIGDKSPDPEQELVIRYVYWAPVLQRLENDLAARIAGNGLAYKGLRDFMISFAGDAIAYQPVLGRKDMYAEIHKVFAATFRQLAEEAGANAPLCVIAHSLGTVISSNYIYDLQAEAAKPIIDPSVKEMMGDGPLEKGETLALLYTIGSPLALWGLRYSNFGTPIANPVPELATRYPQLQGKWFNVYDKDDVIGYPLKPLNGRYAASVTEDIEMNSNGFFSSWNPLSHTHYFESRTLSRHIARSLADIWRRINAV